MSRKGGGGSRSGGGAVNVSGYYRSNGTYVSGYTRSTPSRSSINTTACGYSSISRSDTGGGRTITVSGYTRSDGTQVSGYARGAPRTTSSSKSNYSSNSVEGTVKVSGYTRSDGTRVSGYTRSAPGASKNSSSGIRTVTVSGYTRADGTRVSGYTRTVPQKSDSNGVGNQKFYADNSYNRKLGRVGNPLGSCVIHKHTDHSIVTTSKRNQKHQQLLGESSLEDLIQVMKQMRLPNSQPCNGCTYVDYQYAADQLQRDEVEEEWRIKNLEPSKVDAGDLASQYSSSVLITFANLKLEKIIGRGGFGEVYAACLLGKPVAFKKLIYQRMSQRRIDDFIKEVHILSNIDHPNVIKMIGAVVDESNIGIVMEYLRCSLFRALFVNCEPLDTGKKITIIQQTASALEYLHTKKIAHCDIKSENILLDWNDAAKLCDFGLSALKNDTASTQSNNVLVPQGQGTPRYSAPEVLRGEILNITQLLQADVYSLAIVVFEVMAEEEPFQGLSILQLQTNVGHGEMCPPTINIPNPIGDLLTKCWAKEAANRLTASEFQVEWNNIDFTAIAM